MKVSGRSVALTVAGAALATLGLAAPATAADSKVGAVAVSNITIHTRGDGAKPPAVLGNPAEWGVVELTIDDSAGRVTPKVVIDVGGGTWSYGSYATPNGQYCYSNYLHPKENHSATVRMAGDEDWSRQGPGDVAQAHLTRGAAYTCKTYYSKG